MKALLTALTVFVGLWSDISALAGLELGKRPQAITLSGENGGRVDTNSAWSSDELTGKVHVLFYTTPGEKDTNREASDALKRQKFSGEYFSTVAIVNMEPSWWPNAIINSKLKDSQKEFPRTTYVKDLHRMLVKKWGLADNSNNVVVFDDNGIVIFRVDGRLDSEQVQQMTRLIKSHLAKYASKQTKDRHADKKPKA